MLSDLWAWLGENAGPLTVLIAGAALLIGWLTLRRMQKSPPTSEQPEPGEPIPRDLHPRTPPQGRDPGPRGTSNSHTNPRPIGFIDRPKLLSQILNPPPQQSGVAGPRIAAICSLHGMGGIGKTELVRKAAGCLAPANGIAEVNLRGWDSGQPMTEEEALRELCAQLDPETDPNLTLPQLRAHWRAITAKGHLVVVLDNLRDQDLIDLLRPTQGITLITGRERIVRAGIQLIEVDVMEPDEAKALAIATNPDLTDDDAAALGQAVGYLPLAIRLAAAYLMRTGEPVSALKKRIGQAAGGGRHLQDLFERVVDLSIADLTEEQRARWLALSLPPSDFGLWAVEALWQDEDPLPELGDLANRHLVQRDGESRWRLHDLLRQYGRAVVAAEPEHEQTLWGQLGPEAVNRLCEFDARFRSGGEAMLPALVELDAELPILRAVQAWAASRIQADDVAADVAMRIPHPTVIPFRLSPEDELSWAKTSLQAAHRLGQSYEIGRACLTLSIGYGHLGKSALSLKFSRMSRATFLKIKDEVGVAKSVSMGGVTIREWVEVTGRSGNWALNLAEAIHSESLAMFENLYLENKINEMKKSLGQEHGNLGLVYLRKHNLDKAEFHVLESLRIAQELQLLDMQARQYGNLGSIAFARQDFDRAEQMQRRSAEMHADLGNAQGEGQARMNLGNALIRKDDLLGAIEQARKAIMIAQDLQLPWLANAQYGLAHWEAQLSSQRAPSGGC